jgi:hypothetical protein
MPKFSAAATKQNAMHPRLARELRTVKAMIRIFCKARHRGSDLCEQCAELAEYAERRLVSCPFQEHKATCGKCTVHCYKAEMREKIIEVMRFSGPRMIFRHPFLATAHLIEENKSGQQVESGKSTYKKRNRP